MAETNDNEAAGRTEGDVDGVAVYTPEQYGKAQDMLKKECQEMWQSINDLQQKLKDKTPEVAQNSESALVTVYKAKTALLQAQTEVLRNTPPLLCPDSETIQFEYLKEELIKSVRELQETLTLVKSEQEELDIQKSGEELFKQEIQQVKTVLEEKLEASHVELDREDANDTNKLQQEIKSKEAKISDYSRNLMKRMASFIQHHFPEPTEEQLQKWEKANEQHHCVVNQTTTSTSQVLSLQAILQELMNLSVDSPHNPYLQVTDAFWPPYRELLLRSGIAIRHPDKNDLIRLTPFHL